MKSFGFLIANPFRFVGDEISDAAEVEAAEAAAAAEVAKVKKPLPKVEFSPEQQAYMNSLLAEEKRRGKTIADKAILQLQTLQNQSGTTTAEKERLEVQIEELRSQHLTEKELTAKERKKLDAKKDTEIAQAKAEAETWQKRYTKTTIKRAIVDASLVSEHKATNPAHIVALLSDDTRLVEEMDDDGKPTGEFIAKTKVRTVKDGKSTVLDMTVTEAVKYLSEQEEHAPLFLSGASGGLGGNPNRPRSKGGEHDPNVPPTDPAEYRAWRQKNPTSVGAPRNRTAK